MSKTIAGFLAQGGVWFGVLALAAFLCLYWVLRGAPLGQAVTAEDDEDAPRGGYRDRVIAAVCFGMILILAGASLAVTRGVAWSIPAFALGFGTVLTLVLINRRYRHASPTLRRTLDVSAAALNAALVAGVLVVVNVVAYRYGGRAIDMTRERTYTLSSLTRNQVRSLTRPVTFTSFFGRSEFARRQHHRVQELLELYRAANPEMVHVDQIDPYRDLPRYEALVAKVPQVAVDVTQGGGVVVEYGDAKTADRLVVRNIDLFDIPPAARFSPNADELKIEFKGEDALTAALMRLREGKRPRVVFTTGHGEPPVDDLETNRAGLGLWKSRLVGTGLDVNVVNLLADDLPADTTLIVVAGPRTPFKPDEAQRLKAAFDRKVPVLLLLGDVETSGLEAFLKEANVEVGKGFIVEPRLNLPQERQTVVVPVVNPRHPVIDSLENTFLFFPRPAPLKLLTGPAPGQPPSPSGLLTVSLLKTSRESWVEPDLSTRRAEKNQDDPAGPFDVALAVTDRPPPGVTRPQPPRMAVFSSRYLADNKYVQLDPTNLDLLMNAVNWLRGRAEETGQHVVAPNVHVSTRLMADPVLQARLILVPTVMAVLLIISLGVTTYLARRD